MQEKVNIAVFVDYDNIEIGLKSTLRREFDVSLVLSALKERGDIVAKFAYANWGRQEYATRSMAENAVQMVQRNPSPRGDKNGGDINLALDALEMAFTHQHVTAFAIVSGDSDFTPLVNKLKEYGKTVYVVGGKAFTSTILQQNCHEFISFESLLPDGEKIEVVPRGERERARREKPQAGGGSAASGGGQAPSPNLQGERRQRPAPLDLEQVLPLVDRALQVLERRNVQPQLGLLKSTMLQLDSAFSERAYGASSFSEFVEKLKTTDLVQVSGTGGRYIIERKKGEHAAAPVHQPEDLLPPLRDVLENHRLDCENGVASDRLKEWFFEEQPSIQLHNYGFQGFKELLNYAQDKTVVRLENDAERGVTVFLGAEFYPPALPPEPEPSHDDVMEEDEPQPYVEGQPTIFEPNPPPAKPKKTASPRKRPPKPGGDRPKSSRPRGGRKKPD